MTSGIFIYLFKFTELSAKAKARTKVAVMDPGGGGAARDKEAQEKKEKKEKEAQEKSKMHGKEGNVRERSKREREKEGNVRYRGKGSKDIIHKSEKSNNYCINNNSSTNNSNISRNRSSKKGKGEEGINDIFMKRKKLNENLVYFLWHSFSWFLNLYLCSFHEITATARNHYPDPIPASNNIITATATATASTASNNININASRDKWFDNIISRFFDFGIGSNLDLSSFLGSGAANKGLVDTIGTNSDSYPGDSHIYYLFSTKWLNGRFLLNDDTLINDPYKFGISEGQLAAERDMFTKEVKYFYLLELSFWCSTFIYLFIEKKKKDFYQMLAHHVSTVLLLILSLLDYRWKPGLVTLFLHDIGDIFLYFAKSCSGLKGGVRAITCSDMSNKNTSNNKIATIDLDTNIKSSSGSKSYTYSSISNSKLKWKSRLGVGKDLGFVFFVLTFFFFRLIFYPSVVIFPILGCYFDCNASDKTCCEWLNSPVDYHFQNLPYQNVHRFPFSNLFVDIVMFLYFIRRGNFVCSKSGEFLFS